jgi:hypothetical protein
MANWYEVNIYLSTENGQVDAVTIIELILARNPADNQGVRFLLGSEALRAGDFDHARAVFENEASG